MKVLDKITLALFSCIILIESLVLGLVLFGWVNIETVMLGVKNILQNQTSENITLGILFVLMLLSIKAIFFSSDGKDRDNKDNGILIQNDNGKLFITKDTIQNLVSGVVKGVEGAQDVSSKVILSRDNTISINVILFVNQDIIIKDLSSNLQVKIKDIVKKSIDIDIKEVNVKIKNITPKQETAGE